MEQIIVLIIMLALGSLFGKKKDQAEEQKPRKPAQPVKPEQHTPERHIQKPNAEPEKKPRTLKDFSKELFEDIQKEFKDLQEMQPEPDKAKLKEPVTEVFYAEKKEQPKRRPEKRRSPVTERAEKMQQKYEKDVQLGQEDLIPKTPEQVMQGIVYAEILGPPKSKR